MRGLIMVSCNCKKTNHNNDLACICYIHYSENSKKILLYQKGEERGSYTLSSQSFFHLPHPEHPIFFGHLRTLFEFSIKKKKYYITALMRMAA